jgi:hypothetical protein
MIITLLALIATTLVATVVTFFFVIKNHKTRIGNIQHLYEEQTATIIRTIQESAGIIGDVSAAIDEIELLSRSTPASASIRAKTDELRDLVNGLEELVIMQNIQEGLRSREKFHAAD